MKKLRGFTLIEMMAVVALMSILAAVSIPSVLTVVRNQRGKKNRARIADYIRKTRNLARNTGLCVELRLDRASDGALTTERYFSECNGPSTPPVVVPPDETIVEWDQELSAAVTINFAADGTLKPVGGTSVPNIDFSVRQSGGVTKNLRIRGALGDVEEL